MSDNKTIFFNVILLIALFPGTADADTLSVNETGAANYSNIQDAINNANVGDTILVESGKYYENVNVNKSLILLGVDTGSGNPVVDAGNKNDAIVLGADDILIENFTATNASWYNGVKLISNNITLININASYNGYGIYFEYLSGYHNVTGITATYNNYDGLYANYLRNSSIRIINSTNNDDYGIYLYEAHDNDIKIENASNNRYYGIYGSYLNNNNMTIVSANGNGEDGIYLYEAHNNDIRIENAINNVYNGIYTSYLENNNLTILNVTKNKENGLSFRYSGNNRLEVGNASYNTNDGIYFYSSGYNDLTNSTAINNNNGIHFQDSNYNNLTNNDAIGNFNAGLYIENSNNNKLSMNRMVDNNYNFFLTGYSDDQFNNTIDSLNTVNSRPVYYMKDEAGTYFNAEDAGVIYCIRCSNVTFENAVLTRNYYGVYFRNTQNSSLKNISSSGNYYGVYLSSSGDNNITASTFSNNNEGIYLDSSNGNNISGDNINGNFINGILLYNSYGNELNNNWVVWNSYLDFNVYGTINSGENNTCDKPDGWNDNGVTGCRYLSTSIENYPDFIVTNLTWSPSRFSIGDYVVFNASVKNVGSPFAGDLYVLFSINGESATEGYTSAPFGTDETVYITGSWYANKAGNDLILTATADSANYWAEQNETNNSQSMTIPYIGGADLVIENITWLPDPYSIGDSVTFTATIKNTGDASTPYTNIYLKYYIDGSWLPHQTCYYDWWWGWRCYNDDAYRYGSIAPNASITITSQAWTVSPGMHTIRAVADSNYYVTESNETNNELNITLHAAKASDLIVENISWSPDPILAGQSVTFTAKVKNIGEGNSATTDNYLSFYLDGDTSPFYTTYWYGSLIPNASYDFTGSWTADPGNHSIRAVADSYEYISESNESNNEMNVSLPYIPGPDLIVENITWSPSPYNAGNPVAFTARIRNIGEAASLNTNHYVRFLIDGIYISEPSWSGSLGAGANITITSSAWTALPGNHTVTAHVDYFEDQYYNRIKETDESNNNMSVDLPFTPGPDLVIDSISWSPQNYTAGQSVTFSASIRNAGSRPTNTGFYTLFIMDGSTLDAYGSGVSNSNIIQPGGATTVSQTWNTAQGGNHTLRVITDNSNYYGNRIPEVNETNNEITTMLSYVDLPDLIITDLTWTPYNYAAGDALILNATVKNIGTGTWKGSVRVDFYYKDYVNLGSTSPAMDLPPGSTAYAAFTWNHAQAGDFNFTADIDGYHNIIESNETNNYFLIRKNNVSKPDLIVDSIYLKVDHKLFLRGYPYNDPKGDVLWKYTTTTPSQGWQDSSYDDSAWNTGYAPFGYNAGNYRTALNLGGGYGYFRKTFNFSQHESYNLNIASQDGVDAWINGVQVLAGSSDVHYSTYWNYRENITDRIQSGENILAIRLKGAYSYYNYNYLDAEVAGITVSSPANAKIEAGDIVAINATIKNLGPGKLSSWYLPTYFLVDGTSIGTAYKTLNLSMDQIDIVSQTWIATAGNHTLRAIADNYDYYANSYVDEVNESNNSLTVNLSSIAYPDLVVEDIYWSPQNYSAGQTVTLYARLRNAGPGYVYSGDGFYTMFFVDGSYLYSYGTNYPKIIAPGENVDVAQTWLGQGGNHTVKVIADYSYYYGNRVTEVNESNNELTKNLTPIVYPDLVITDVTATRGGITGNISDLNASDGEPIIFNATIKNLGPGDISATDLNVGFYIDGSLAVTGSRNQGLPAGGSGHIVSSAWYATPGNHTFLAKADHTNAIQEASETNNGLSSALNPVPYPDIIISNISWSPARLSDGGEVIFNATVQNIGAGDTSRDILTRFYIDGTNIGDRYIYGGLSSGGSSVVSQKWTAVFGRQRVSAYADDSYTIQESNESNNSISANLSFLEDQYQPQIISTRIEPANLTEHTTNPEFYVEAADVGSGIDPERIYLNYSISGVSYTKTASYISGNTYRAILTSFDLYLDPHQGETLSYNFIVYDRGDNRVESALSYEYIDPIDDIPVITIQSPDSASRWKGTQVINWSVNNDNEGPTNSTVYYWKPSPWAPSFIENSTQYFSQGNWIRIADSTQDGMDTLQWDTTVFDGYTKIKIEATDGINTVSKVSDVFIVDNLAPIIEIKNYRESGGNYLTAENPLIMGAVNGTISNVTGVSINLSDFNLTLSPMQGSQRNFEFRSDVNYSGTFSVNISASDEPGNKGNLEVSFLVDSELPFVRSAEFTNLFTGNPVYIKVNTSDDHAVEKVMVSIFGETLFLNRTFDDLYTGTIFAPYIEGAYQADVIVRDAAGNVNSNRYDLEILSGPDLEINSSGISLSPLAPVTGERLNITARINNLGSSEVGYVPVNFLAEGRIIGSQKFNLSASPYATFNWITEGFAGNVEVGASIGNSTNYTETNYSNNYAERSIFIDGPDLNVTNIVFNPVPPVYEGQAVTITATIVNLKPIAANNVRISFYQNRINLSDRIDFRDVNVPASGSADVSVNWQTAGLTGLQEIIVEANTDNLPAEVDRSNNILNASFETKKYIAEQIPDLLIFPQKTLPAIAGEKIRGMASNDFNRDNRTDFVTGTDKGKIILYKNNGVFYTNENKTKNVNFTQYLIDDIQEAAWGMTSADFFGDNYPDLIVGTGNGRVIFYNNSNGIFVNNITLLDAGDQAYGLAASDFNNDNKFDLAIGNKKGQVDLYINNMTGNVLTNTSMVFNRTLTTRNQPFGLTTGDFDLDGHSDVMVGDGDGQIERIVWEIDRYNGFLFADVGSFAHGLTAADIDYSGKLDLFSTGFDGNVRMFFSREGGLVADPLIIGNIPESYGITSGDYDSDNDIDVIVGSDNGNVTMLMNSLRILKTTIPSPSPPRREIEVESQIQNPWAREMIELNLTETWMDEVGFVKGGEIVCLDDYCTSRFYGDVYLYETPWDNSTYNVHYYLNFSNKAGSFIKILRIEWRYSPSNGWVKGIRYLDYGENAILKERSFELPKVLQIFDGLDMLRLREGFKYKYKFMPDSITNVSAVSKVNYSVPGMFNTPNTDYLLSDDVTNLNNIVANTRNINPDRMKTDRDFVDDPVLAPDLTPTSLVFSDYTFPPVPGKPVTATVTVKNLNGIGINNVKVRFIINDVPVNFGAKDYTTFSIGPMDEARVSASTSLPSSVGGQVNVTVIVNPFRDDIETNYENNNISNSLSAYPPADLRNEGVYFSNGTAFKNVFTEGEQIRIFTNISNIGMNRSYSQDVMFISIPPIIGVTPCCGRITPVDRKVDCSPGSPDYDADLCDGEIINYNEYQFTAPGNIDPGVTVSTNVSNILGDFKLRSHGVYNITTIVTNAGSLDENHANDASFTQLIVLPSQEDLQFDYPYCDPNTLDDIYLANPAGSNVTLEYGEINTGGYDVSGYDSIIYLDNNDSVVLARIVNGSLANHTSGSRMALIDWSKVTSGDHKVNFYLDYGKNSTESVARAVSVDGLIFSSKVPGISGNGLSISIQNITQDTFRLVITKKTEVVEQTAFDLNTRTETRTVSYDRNSGNSEIRDIGDIVDVIQNGGYGSGQFIPSNWLNIDINGADPTTKPAVQTLNLIISGSVASERSDFNNEHSMIFRWKELVLKDIKFNPIFPSSGDIVTISSTIKNDGDIRTGQFNVTMFIGGAPVETKAMSLLAHETGSISFIFKIPRGEEPSYDVRIEADPENVIGKEDRRDNNITTYIPLSAPFELNVFSREHNVNFLSSYLNGRNMAFTSASFNLENISMEYDTSPVFVDYDLDEEDYDLITGSLDGKLVSYENTGTEIAPKFRETNWSNVVWKPEDVTNVMIATKYYNTINFSSLDVGARSVPEFFDLDNDSLMDMVIGDTHGRLRSFKSVIVERNSVKKRAWVEYDFNLSKVDQVMKAVPRFADLDGDGNADLIVGNIFGKIAGYENTGNSSNPDWARKDFNLSSIYVGENAAPATGDIDLDGDLDLVVGNGTGISIYENTGSMTEPAWKKLDFSLSISGRTDYRPALADLDNDHYPDLVFGSNNFTRLKLNRGYYEPVNVQIINYAKNQIDIIGTELSVLNATSGVRLTDLLMDGPLNHFVNYDNILKGYRISSQGVLEKEYALNIPADLPDNTVLGVRASKQENVNPAYFYELDTNGGFVRGERTSPVYINRPELGGDTFDLFVEPGSVYEYRGSYKVFFNGTMSRQYDCLQNWCPIYGLTEGEINTIVGSGEIRRLIHLSRPDFDIVTPDKPPVTMQIANKSDLKLKPGYIEDIELSVENNNRRPYTIDRIAIELYNNSRNETWNSSSFDETKIIDLFTDTSGFTLPPQETTGKKYKVYIPDGAPVGAALLVKAIEKHPLLDQEFERSNIKELWPQGSTVFYDNITPYNLYNSSNVTQFTDITLWGKQGFDYGLGCDGCGPEESFLRKLVWMPANLIKSEQKEYLHQLCDDYYYEQPSGITVWVNGKLKSSLNTACNEITYGWTPNFYELNTGENNEVDLYSYGPHRQFDIMFYEMVSFDNISNATVVPEVPAFEMNVTGIGNHGLLRRQYEEKVNITVTNNDDDPVTVDAVTIQLMTPQNKKIHLMTDTEPRPVASGSNINVTYVVPVPGDVPLNSGLIVQVEKVYEFPDKLWGRDHEISLPALLSDSTKDYHWGDTLPTTDSSKYRKRYFAPNNVTRAEMILGDSTGLTDAYLNGEFQGSGYPGWSPISLSSGLRQGELNLLSITGAIPDTQSRIYSGFVKTGGTVIEPEEEVYFAVFGIREEQFISGREPFSVLPGERVTARIRIENKYNRTLDYTMRLYAVDFKNQNEISLQTQTVTVSPFEIKKLETDLRIPATVSNDTRLQLSSVWNEELSDKNWLRGSNFNDQQASNNYLDDAQWGVVEVGAGNERAKYFRKHMWVDSTVQGIRISKTNVEKMWVNGLEVAGDTLKNEFTKSERNLITLKARDYDIDADIQLDHFVPVRSTDIDSADLNYSSMPILSQDNVTHEDQSSYDCSNRTAGECIYKVEKGEIVRLNFTLRNAGELFARAFNLTVYARNADTGKVTEFSRETITMHPFSTDVWNVSWNTSKLKGGMYEFIVFPDADDEIIETSEYNNMIVRKVYVNARPEIKYLDYEELSGYNENVSINAEILDEDGNLRNLSLNLTGPNNSVESLEMSGSGTIFSAAYNTTERGRYRMHLLAADDQEKDASATGDFDIFDSLFLNVRTDKDVYFFTQKVRLMPAKPSDLTKQAPNNNPFLVDAFDDTEKIKGGERITIRTDAYDPDGDIVTLYVCRGNKAGAGGCEGGVPKTYCSSSGSLNPSCSFNTERDDITHEWFAFLVDKKGLVDGPVMGNYTADSTPPVTRIHSLASDGTNPVDTQNDSKTIVTIEGEPGVNCRIGKDPVNRFHQDRSYSFLEKECSSSNGTGVCNLGDIKKDDPSRDRITNLTRAYVSCRDDVGNEQTTLENIDVIFGVDPTDLIFDDYQGGILARGSKVTISGSTKYCADEAGICTPDTIINNGEVVFDRPGIHHLRYNDSFNTIKDTVVLVNSRPEISDQEFRDHLGEHAFDVSVKVSDPDAQVITCELTAGGTKKGLAVHNGRAETTLRGNLSESITTQISCTDGFETVSSDERTYTFPNRAPMLRNIPDISVEPGETSGIDTGYFGFDLENDALSYSIVSQDSTAIAAAVITSRNLTVNGIAPGISNICLKASDGESDSNIQCVNVFVEDGTESKLKNNEFAGTNVRLLMQIQYNNGSWQDEYTQETRIQVLPGSKDQIDLAGIFEWNTSTSSRPEGLFRVLFRALDENNNTLFNRDGKEILDSYNFTLVLFNTPPEISGIPDQMVFENEPSLSINLLDHTSDSEQNIEDLYYAVEEQTNPGSVNCTITGGYIISCIPAPNQTGISEINVSVFDGFAYDYDNFTINVIPYKEFIKAGNITYTYISNEFDVSGSPYSGYRNVSVGDTIPPGRYNITVIVSNGELNVSRNISVIVALPGVPVLDAIGNRTVRENETLAIQINATDLEGDPLLYGTNARDVLPGAVSFNGSSGLFEWTPTFDDSGNYSVTFHVNDGSFTASETINISVQNVNRPPVLDFIPDITVNESDLMAITANASDPDNENNATNDDNNLTVFINDTRFTKNGNYFTWQTGFNDSGNYVVIVTVGDGELTDSQEVNLTVLNVEPYQASPKVVNNSPIGSNVPVNAVITVTFSKAMNVTSVEKAVSIQPAVNGVFEWNSTSFTFTPESLSYNTTYNVTITAVAEDTDGNLMNDPYTWEFITEDQAQANNPPVADEKIVSTSMNMPVNINLTGSDPDGDALTFVIVDQPSNGTLSGSVPYLVYTPDLDFTGTDHLTYKASDGKSDSAIANISITVTSGNRKPVIVPIGDQFIRSGTILNVSITAGDPDGDALVLSATGLPSFAVFTDNGNGTGRIIFTLCSAGPAVYPITITASDGSLYDSIIFDLIVNNLPLAADDQVIAIIENTSVNITLTGSDPDENTLSFSLETMPVHGTLSGTSPNLIYTPDPGYNGKDNFMFRTSDGYTGSGIATVNITVVSRTHPDSTLPLIESVSLYPAKTTAGSTINISIKASDNTGILNVTANGNKLIYSGGQWKGNITGASSAGTYAVVIKATDTSGNSIERKENYSVVNRVGGISVTSIPKPLVLTPCSSGILNIRLNSTANIDDMVEVTINTNGIASTSAIDLTWFNRTRVLVPVPAGKAVYVQFRISVPSGIPAGYKTFKNNAKSLGFNATSVDTGVVNVKP